LLLLSVLLLVSSTLAAITPRPRQLSLRSVNGGSANANHNNWVLNSGSGEYFAYVGIGSPPQYIPVILDTGQQLIELDRVSLYRLFVLLCFPDWFAGSSTLAVPASPCTGCLPGINYFFDPSLSSTAQPVLCSDPICTGGCSAYDPTLCGFYIG
jgi:hypothetical protein